MTKFKVGDKVKRKKPSHDPKIYGEMGVVYTISRAYKAGETDYFKSEEGIEINCIDSYWELVDNATTHFPLYSEEAAVKLLTERGYEVKAPPEPLKGKAYVFSYKNDGTLLCSGSPWQGHERLGYKLIAIVDWTEGQGLNTSK